MTSMLNCISSGFQAHAPHSIEIGPFYFAGSNTALGLLKCAGTSILVLYGIQKIFEKFVYSRVQAPNRADRLIHQLGIASYPVLAGCVSVLLVKKAISMAFKLGCGSSAIPAP
jgi:hypothetical protein